MFITRYKCSYYFIHTYNIKRKNTIYAINSAKQSSELLYIIKEIKYRHAKNHQKLLRQNQKAVYLHPK